MSWFWRLGLVGLVGRLAVTVEMLFCLSFARVLDSEKVKTAAVAGRCETRRERRLGPARAHRHAASARSRAAPGYITTCADDRVTVHSVRYCAKILQLSPTPVLTILCI